MADGTAQAHDCAVMMACDGNYLPFALHLAWQIAVLCPERRFDILIAGPTAHDLPDWAVRMGIASIAVAQGPEWAKNQNGRITAATYLPLSAAAQLAGRYRRLLALDCDIWFEGGDLDRFLAMDIGPHPLAAARDVVFLNGLDSHAPEFKVLGLPAMKALNAGVVLYDTAAYVAQDMEARLLAMAVAHPGKFRLMDQALLNVVLQGNFAEFSPVWNWMSNQRLQFATYRMPPKFRHFVGPKKPWADAGGSLDARYDAGYREFFRTRLPEALALMAPRRRTPLGLREIARLAVPYLRNRARLQTVMAQFPDEWTVLP